jgi:hypothetical protein
MSDLALGAMFSSRFQFSAFFVDMVERGINHEVEDVLYNYIDATSMTKSQIGHVFRVLKEFHVITLHDFIDVYLPLDYTNMDLNYRTCIFFHPILFFLDSTLFLQTFVSLTFAFDCFYRE